MGSSGGNITNVDTLIVIEINLVMVNCSELIKTNQQCNKHLLML